MTEVRTNLLKRVIVILASLSLLLVGLASIAFADDGGRDSEKAPQSQPQRDARPEKDGDSAPSSKSKKDESSSSTAPAASTPKGTSAQATPAHPATAAKSGSQASAAGAPAATTRPGAAPAVAGTTAQGTPAQRTAEQGGPGAPAGGEIAASSDATEPAPPAAAQDAPAYAGGVLGISTTVTPQAAHLVAGAQLAHGGHGRGLDLNKSLLILGWLVANAALILLVRNRRNRSRNADFVPMTLGTHAFGA